MPPRRSATALRPRRTPVQARSRATVDVILEAAARVFASLGYAATTTNKVAARAGVSVGSLYEYFPCKDALLVALIERHMTTGEELLGAAGASLDQPAGELRESVEGMVRAMVVFHASDRTLHRVLFEEAPLSRGLRQRLEAVERRIAGRVAGYLRGHPQVTSEDPDLAAAVVVQTVEGLTHRLVVHGEHEVPLERWVAEITSLVTAYLTAPRCARPGASPRKLLTASATRA